MFEWKKMINKEVKFFSYTGTVQIFFHMAVCSYSEMLM